MKRKRRTDGVWFCEANGQCGTTEGQKGHVRRDVSEKCADGAIAIGRSVGSEEFRILDAGKSQFIIERTLSFVKTRKVAGGDSGKIKESSEPMTMKGISAAT
jgi:hypothetical protein